MLRRVIGPGRRPDDWTTPHERALVRLSERLDAPLDPDEATWLSAHLDACDACRSAAVAYLEQREMLRGLAAPELPRDLAARTFAAIEAEEAHRHGVSGARPSWSRRLTPLGAVASVVVVALVVGATAFAPLTNVAVVDEVPSITAGRPSVAPASPGASAPPPLASQTPPAPTPIVLADAAPVSWAEPAGDGSYAVNLAPVSEVCAPRAAPDCAPIEAAATPLVTIERAPASVTRSPAGGQLVVADAGTRAGGGAVYALAIGEPSASASPSPATSPSVAPTPSPSVAPSTIPSPTPSGSPSSAPTATPTVTPPASPSPSGGPGPEPSPSVVPSPSLEPSPSAVARRLAILDGVILVDEAAAYSPSGSWFAFTARPASGGQGPDVWIWQAGWDSARPLTTDHRSVLGGWIGETIVASRFAAPDPAAGAEASVESFVVDPASGAVESFSSGPIWRPSVDPMGHFAVYWEGTVAVDPATYEPRPAAGRLVVARLEGGEGQTLEDQVTILDGPVRDFDARWDERGGRLALWVADHEAEGVGSLSAYPIDPSTGVDLDRPLLDDVLALPGISIGQGRLAWATPPGQGGEGSRLQVLAWSGPDAGTVSSAPGVGDAPVVVVR